jgi:hypothetical protein
MALGGDPNMNRDVQDWIIIDDVVVSLTRSGQAEDSVWREFAQEIDAAHVTKCLGGALANASLTSVQRKIVADALKRNNVKVAAITDDRLVRGVITAVSWLGVNIKSFEWSQILEAAHFLEIPEHKTRLLTEALLRLKNKPVVANRAPVKSA